MSEVILIPSFVFSLTRGDFRYEGLTNTGVNPENFYTNNGGEIAEKKTDGETELTIFRFSSQVSRWPFGVLIKFSEGSYEFLNFTTRTEFQRFYRNLFPPEN
jgi:hypothetical protein